MPDVVLTCLLSEAAHRHVLDHAGAQRADAAVGNIGEHRGVPLTSRRLLDLRCSGSDAPIVTRYRALPRQNALTVKAAPSRASGFVLCPSCDIRDHTDECRGRAGTGTAALDERHSEAEVRVRMSTAAPIPTP